MTLFPEIGTRREADWLERAAEAERARIVAWLVDTEFGDDELDAASLKFADRIQSGDHIKGVGDG